MTCLLCKGPARLRPHPSVNPADDLAALGADEIRKGVALNGGFDKRGGPLAWHVHGWRQENELSVFQYSIVGFMS